MGQKVINGDLNVTGAIKHNGTEISYQTTDTNTWRQVKMNGSEILGSATNTNPLDIKAGSNISLTNNNGEVTISANEIQTYNAYFNNSLALDSLYSTLVVSPATYYNGIVRFSGSDCLVSFEYSNQVYYVKIVTTDAYYTGAFSSLTSKYVSDLDKYPLSNLESKITAQGDLIVGNALGNPARLGIGSNGQVVTANNGSVAWGNVPTPSGVQYTAYVSGTPTIQSNPLKFVKLTQTEYTNLQNKDSDTFYIIVGA